MADVLRGLLAAGLRSKAADEGFVVSHYLSHPDRLSCQLAFDPADFPWSSSGSSAPARKIPTTCQSAGSIGSHLRPSAARRGVAAALFEYTLETARRAKLPAIEGFMGKRNQPAIRYYEAMGFETRREVAGADEE